MAILTGSTLLLAILKFSSNRILTRIFLFAYFLLNLNKLNLVRFITCTLQIEF
jgi:hypothetical protein